LEPDLRLSAIALALAGTGCLLQGYPCKPFTGTIASDSTAIGKQAFGAAGITQTRQKVRILLFWDVHFFDSSRN